MSGTLIKGTIQIQDTESVVAKNTGVTAQNTKFVDLYEVEYISAADETALATNLQNALNSRLGFEQWSAISININIQGTVHSAFITWVRAITQW